jgi:hypothetical protein
LQPILAEQCEQRDNDCTKFVARQMRQHRFGRLGQQDGTAITLPQTPRPQCIGQLRGQARQLQIAEIPQAPVCIHVGHRMTIRFGARPTLANLFRNVVPRRRWPPEIRPHFFPSTRPRNQIFDVHLQFS